MIKEDDVVKKLLEKKIIEASELEKVRKEAKIKKVDLLDILNNKVDVEVITQIKADLYKIPYINLIEKNINDEVLRIISSEVSENYKVICFEKNKNEIKVGIIDPDNFKAIEAIDFLAKEEKLIPKYYFISNVSFKEAFKKYKSLSKELKSALSSRDSNKDDELITEEEKKDNYENVSKSAPVAKIVSVIIRHAIDGNASDIHIELLKKESRIRYRIDGILHTSLILPGNVHRSIVARVKIMANMKLDESRIPQDGRFRMIINDKDIDFRVSTLPLNRTEKVVLRILDTSKGAPSVEDLGVQGKALKIIKNNIKKTTGLLLVTGPTGSGKSTTLFSILDILNKESVNIATLEDPVEYQIQGINQSQIKPSIGYTFASGLRSFLRQDPDIIMVGEIRDQETAELSTHAALTGHFVLSTLHTNNALAAVARLVDMGVEKFLIGSTLNTIIAQRLVRKICKHCKEEINISGEYADDIRKNMNELDLSYVKEFVPDYDESKIKAYQGKGCARCGNTGYSGRLAILEVIDFNIEIQNIIKNDGKIIDEEFLLKNQNFINAKKDGIIKVLQGLTTFEEVLRVMKN